MLYEVDTFGFTSGYLRGDYRIMSEEDMIHDRSLIKELKVAKYKQWRRHNIAELIREYGIHGKKFNNFDFFCRNIYDNLTKS